MEGERIVLHVDMDAFYAAVEIQHRPELRGLPVVIGADPKGGKGRGVVSTANYEARRFGIHSAMAISKAYEACPEAVYLAPSFHLYKPASAAVMDILGAYADVLQVVGMDEAYLDVTDACNNDWNRVPAFARSLQAAVKRQTGLSCSVGAAPSKSVAKIASDYRKPHGATIVPPKDVTPFLEPLPVRLVNGCGPKTVAKLREDRLLTVGDLAAANEEMMQQRYGKHGIWLWNVANGNDDRPVVASRGPSKSRGNERTYGRDETDGGAVLAHAHRLLEGLLESKDRRSVSTFSVKIRYSDFSTLTRSHTLSIPISPEAHESLALASATISSLLQPLLDGRAIRLVGVRLSNFGGVTGQQSLSRFGLDSGAGARMSGSRPAPGALFNGS